MRAALDATPLTLSSGGLRRYVEELSRALAAGHPADEFLLTSDQPFETAETPNLKTSAGPRRGLDRRWWSVGLNRELARFGADIFHGTNFEVPYIQWRPAVVTIHDLSPWMNPEWQSEAARVRRRLPLLLRAGAATMVITVSRAVREQVIRRFRLDPDRVAAVPNAPSPVMRPVENRPERPYFLCLGTIEPRKNLAMLLEAWRVAGPRTGAELVIAGRRRSDAPELPETPGVRYAGEVAEAALPGLYSGAIACLYPSLYEGFGLPVLEAMACGALVVASKDPAIAEIAADAALLLDPRDPLAWANAIDAAATHSNLAAEWRARGLERAKQYTWAATARQTRDVYLEAIRRFYE